MEYSVPVWAERNRSFSHWGWEKNGVRANPTYSVNVVSRVSHLLAPWSGKIGRWERGCSSTFFLSPHFSRGLKCSRSIFRAARMRKSITRFRLPLGERLLHRLRFAFICASPFFCFYVCLFAHLNCLFFELFSLVVCFSQWHSGTAKSLGQFFHLLLCLTNKITSNAMNPKMNTWRLQSSYSSPSRNIQLSVAWVISSYVNLWIPD